MRMTQSSKLNLFTSRSNTSRSTAGTMPIVTPKMTNEMMDIDVNEPELLPVSCGYFFNIVR